MKATLDGVLHLLRTSYVGLDNTLPGNGGIECYDFLTFKQRITDTLVFTLLAAIFIAPKVLKTLTLPKEWEIVNGCRKRTAQRIVGFRKVLLIVLCLVFGIEIGYKLSQESWIYLLNPCHVITSLQVCM